MSTEPSHHRVRAAGEAYRRAHETIREHAAKIRAERQAVIDAGAVESGRVDELARAGVIRAGTTLNPEAPR